MRWSRKGVRQGVFNALAQDADNEYAMIDGTIVRTHRHAAGAKGASKKAMECIGRSRGGPSTKIHATRDALGNPTGFHPTPGQACDLDGAEVPLDGIAAGTLIADKGYDADARVIERPESAPVAPPKSNRKEPRVYDKALYKPRHLIENLFEKIKHYTAIATRYDKTATPSLGAIHLVASPIWLN